MRSDLHNILFVPLDDRPCCLDLVIRQAALAGKRLLTPPRELLGRFKLPGSPESILDWLESQNPELPLIASVDMLTWGGLIASRHPESDSVKAEENFSRFCKIQEGRKGTTFVFKTLLRTAPTQTTVLETEQAEQIVALSQLGFTFEKLRATPQEHHIAKAMEQVKKGIDPDFLQRYLDVRKRNHLFDKKVVQQSSKFDALLIALDDCQTEGWNLLEMQRLEKLAETTGGQTDFYPGTDESAGLLLARLVGENEGVDPVWSHSHLALTQTRYEDRPLGALLQSQLKAARLLQGRCSRKLFLFGRLGSQKESAQQNGRIQGSQETMEKFLQDLTTALDAGDLCVVADLAFANGGDLGLVDALLERGLASRLAGYSAWNTAGNTLGTALSTLVLCPLEPTAEQERARKILLWERLTDDAFYQSLYRFRLKKMVGPGLLLDGEELVEAETFLASEFHEFAARLWSRLFPDEPALPFKVTFPWGRLFEVSIDPTDQAVA